MFISARWFTALILLLASIGLAEEDFKSQLPRIAPLDPDVALKSFKIIDGFRIELAAAEPMVADPIAMAFDAFGRLFVVEMRGYSEDPDEDLGRVRLLEDTTGDGRFDKSTVFLDGLSWPTAITCYDGGVFVAVAPDILYCRDTDGDGKADVRRRVLTGFARGNVQGLVNTFKWGLDNRIHGATSSSGAKLKHSYDPNYTLTLRGRDFSFNPRTLDIRPTSGGAQHGMSFDDWGRKFVCSNSDHLQFVMYNDRDAARNPYQAAPRSRMSIAVDGGQAPVFRISPIEPWRIVRTRLRVAGTVGGPIEGGGKPAGYFTGSTGATIYRGGAFGWDDTYAIIGDVGSNIVHRKLIEPKGVGFVGKRVDQKREFVASSDIWFRPVQFANGPDGALYIADMYREVIEHPKSLPPMIKKHLDLTSGRDRGRIWRVVPANYRRGKPIKPGKLSTIELVKLLEHRNGQLRTTASRLLFERRDHAAVEPLLKLVKTGSPQARVHALSALVGLKVLTAEAVLVSLKSDHPRVREFAVRVARREVNSSPAVRRYLYSMTNDNDVRVRYQLAFTLGEVVEPGRLDVLLTLAKKDGNDQWMRFAVLSSLYRDAKEFALNEDLKKTSGGREIIKRLNEQVVRMERNPRPVVPAQLSVLDFPRENRDEIVALYRKSLSMKGDAVRGKALFEKNCSTCHRLDGIGKETGPNLAAMVNRGAEAILLNVLDPNREVNPQFTTYSVETIDGDNFIGMIVSESATNIDFVLGDGTTRSILRIDVETIRGTGLSLMPEGLEKNIDRQAMADLLAYIMKK